jgi:hypothetical protein
MNVRIYAMDIQSSLGFIENGIAAGLVPESVLNARPLPEKSLQRVTLKAPVSNRIRIAHLHKRTMGLSARLCMQWVHDTLTELQQTKDNKN